MQNKNIHELKTVLGHNRPLGLFFSQGIKKKKKKLFQLLCKFHDVQDDGSVKEHNEGGFFPPNTVRQAMRPCTLALNAHTGLPSFFQHQQVQS